MSKERNRLMCDEEVEAGDIVVLKGLGSYDGHQAEVEELFPDGSFGVLVICWHIKIERKNIASIQKKNR